MSESTPVGLAAVKHRLGRVGVWMVSVSEAPAEVERRVALAVEQLGYSAFWFGETPQSKEALTHAAAVLSWTDRIQVATGIANIYARDAVAAANGAVTLADAWPERFVLGLGVSHAPLVTTRGHEYGRPVATMRSYLEAMDSVRPALPARAPRLLAALRPKMLELSRTHADGAHTYFATPEHTARARELLGADPVLAVEQAVVAGTDVEAARVAAREYAATYLRLPNYLNHLRELGFSDADFEGGGSDALIDAIVPSGDPDSLAERVRAHHDAGADHVCVQPIAATLDEQVEHLRLLAPVLTT